MKIIVTLSYVLHNTKDWLKFCLLHGISEYACSDGFGDSEIVLNEQQAHHLGLICLSDHKVKPFDEVYRKV